MNTQFKVKLLSHLNKKNQNKGFTLIELLVVVIIVGVLAAIALPNLLGQISKARQTEAKVNLGAINNAQQAYRLEKGRFGKLTSLSIAIGTKNGDNYDTDHYVFSGPAAAADAIGPLFAQHKATAVTAFEKDVKDYGSAVGQTAGGDFSKIICETLEIDGNTPPPDITHTDGAALTCAATAEAVK